MVVQYRAQDAGQHIKSRVCVCNPLAALHVRRTQKKEKQNKKEESLGVEKKRK